MIVKDILEWIESLPKWQQQLGYLIFEKKHITEEELQNIYEVFKIEIRDLKCLSRRLTISSML